MIPLRTLIATGLIITVSSFAIAQESSYELKFNFSSSQVQRLNDEDGDGTLIYPDEYIYGYDYVSTIEYERLWYNGSKYMHLGSDVDSGHLRFVLSDAGKVYATKIVIDDCESRKLNPTISVNGVEQVMDYQYYTYEFALNKNIEDIVIDASAEISFGTITVYYTDAPDTPDTPIIDADQVDSATSIATVDVDGKECYTLSVDVSFVPNSAADEFKLMYGNNVLVTASQAGDDGSYHFAVTGFEYQSGATFSVVPVINSEEQDAVAIEVSDWPDFENNAIELPAENTMLSVDLENGWFYLQVAADKYIPSDFQVTSDLEASITYDASQALIKIIFPDYFVVAGDEVSLNITPIYSVAYQVAEQRQSRAENYSVQQVLGQTITRKYTIPVGVSSIVDVEAAADCEPTYYDLAGRQVSGRPTFPGVYLVKLGDKVTKVAIR